MSTREFIKVFTNPPSEEQYFYVDARYVVKKDLNGEKDPNGIPQNAPGAKLDEGKLRVGLVLGDFCRALSAVASVGTFGASKYSDHGWLSVPNGSERYTDALFRHHFGHCMGELNDQDSGLLHLAHRAWNDLAILELYLRQQEGK